MVVFAKKEGKNASFFINPMALDSKKKMINRIMWKKLINPLNHLKQLKNWNRLLAKFMEIFTT